MKFKFRINSLICKLLKQDIELDVLHDNSIVTMKVINRLKIFNKIHKTEITEVTLNSNNEHYFFYNEETKSNYIIFSISHDKSLGSDIDLIEIKNLAKTKGFINISRIKRTKGNEHFKILLDNYIFNKLHGMKLIKHYGSYDESKTLKDFLDKRKVHSFNFS